MTGNRQLKVVPSAHPAGLCDLAYYQDGTDVCMVTAGQDGKVCYRNADDPSKVAQAIMHAAPHDQAKPFNCVAVSAKGVVAGEGDREGVDNYAKMFTFPGGEAKSGALLRFTLPVHVAAFSPSGSTLAVGGDEEGIKLVNTQDNKVFRKLSTQPYTRGLAFDPEGKFVATSAADGTLCVWDIATGKAVMQLKKACPKVDVAAAARSRPAWHPDGGSLLAAPGTDKDIVLYERLSWTVAYELKGEHSADVQLVAFSKNGLYLASAGADQVVVVWDVLERKALGKRVLAGTACAVAWHPAKNTLALITDDGEVAVWDDVIPADLPGPNDDPDLLNGVAKGAAGLEDPSLMGAGGAARDGFASDGYDVEDSFLDDGEDPAGGRMAGAGKRRRDTAFGSGVPSFDLPAPQDPIQPGSTQAGDSGRRYLAYTPLGCVVLRAEEDHNTVEVAFHDTARMRRRIPLFKDFYNLCMAALGEKGVLYASRSNAESPSTVLYQPYESWANNSDWSLGLPAGEEAECVAAGQAFAAVATSHRLLRLFSLTGLQRSVVSMAGAPVALAASGHQLAAVWHAAAPTPAGDQQLTFAVYDVAEQREVASGPLPLSPGATLRWLGFSEEGLLAAYDSEGELRLRSPEFGGCWVPLFSSAAERKGSEAFWVFGLSARQLQCVVVSGAAEPAVPPPPQRLLWSSAPLRAPVVGQDAALAPLEADIIRHGVLLSHTAERAREEGAEAEAEAELLAAHQLEADKLALKLITRLIQSDRLARALEAASQLHTMAALEGALKLANQLRAPSLADRLSAFIEQRLAMEAAAAAVQEEEQELYCDMDMGEGMRAQGEAVTPLAAPAFPASDAPQQPTPSAGVKSSRVSPPRQQAEAAADAGLFARRPVGGGGGGQNAAPNGAAAGAGAAAAAAKRKAPAGNPFARKSKAAKS